MRYQDLIFVLHGDDVDPLEVRVIVRAGPLRQRRCVVLDAARLVFPSYDGNGMFRSLGNMVVNPWVGMLFIDFENPARLRVNGRASVHYEHAWLERWPEADLLVEVAIAAVFPNCPRYIHRLERREASPYVPRPGCETPRPAWKESKSYRDVLRPRDRLPKE